MNVKLISYTQGVDGKDLLHNNNKKATTWIT